jgi:4'-phosphopantetheinyl transferase
MDLAPGAVHIHFAPLDIAPLELEQAETFLSSDEIIRCNQLRNTTVRNRFVAGRSFLRRTLAGYLETAPHKVALAEGEHGKPYLVDPAQHHVLRFNLTHKHDLAALAVSGGCEVGIDLEELRKTIPFRSMAKRFFNAREVEELLSLPPEQQVEAFYRGWTRKEAYLKGLGTGLTRAANSFRVSLLPDHSPLLNDFQHPEIGRNWTLRDVPVAEGFCAALATEGEPTGITFFPWT